MPLNLVQHRGEESVWDQRKFSDDWDTERWLASICAGALLLAAFRRRSTAPWLMVAGAAGLAYYFFFALFPALLFLVALASYFPLTTLIDGMFRMLGGFVPQEALTLITDQIRKISESKQGGLLTLGMALTLWSTSAAMT